MSKERKILKSWKEIASYLGVGIRTAQRWKNERGLPVRQPGSAGRSAVLGLPHEIDQWLQGSSAMPSRREARRDIERPELAGIIATDALWGRHSRPAYLDREVDALLALGRAMAYGDESTILQKIATYALELCKAESSGFSILETGKDAVEIFRWTATTGRMQQFEGGWTPANFSPCGVCLERNSPQLFRHPERYYTYLEPISPLSELLLIPIHEGNAWVGTIWVICHEKRRQFDRQDARLMMNLGTLASAAILAGRSGGE